MILALFFGTARPKVRIVFSSIWKILTDHLHYQIGVRMFIIPIESTLTKNKNKQVFFYNVVLLQSQHRTKKKKLVIPFP